VGSAAQTKAMRKVAAPLRLQLAQYRELQAFAQFGSVLMLMRQPLGIPQSMSRQVAKLFAGTHGYLDHCPILQVPRLLQELTTHLTAHGQSVLERLETSGTLSPELEQELTDLLDGFKAHFIVQEG